jgi:hypothetical protein
MTPPNILWFHLYIFRSSPFRSKALLRLSAVTVTVAWLARGPALGRSPAKQLKPSVKCRRLGKISSSGGEKQHRTGETEEATIKASGLKRSNTKQAEVSQSYECFCKALYGSPTVEQSLRHPDLWPTYSISIFGLYPLAHFTLKDRFRIEDELRLVS